TNIVFVNGSYRGDDAVGRLMSDFTQIDTDKINNRLLARRITETRAEAERLKKGDNKMIVTEFDKVLMQERAEGREEGREEGVIDMARRMLAGGKLSVEEIAEYSSLPVERVRDLAKGA
ncbi:MAG: hypothetical protein IKH76_10710, partial [Clostridiales bacterium]|nr:hypothetical protein [Clostridiales bacterium]